MMFGAPDNAPSNTARIPSIIILGADALLAALPATPIQLAHACMRIGYQHVLPASWGDELIAAATLRELRNHSNAAVIQCSCPFVASRLLAAGTDLRPFLISLVAPPVLLARYLRALQGQRKLRITYVGRCPGAADEAIDARLTPEELLATFADHEIDVHEQPQVFDAVLPPDRRRYRSQPGGLPTPEMLWLANADEGNARTIVELFGDELPVELAQHLLAGKPVLIDAAPKLGCVCSGATAEGDPTQARARVAALEPPRALSPVIDETIHTDAVVPLPASSRSAIDIIAPSGALATTLSDPSPNDAAPPPPARDESALGRPAATESLAANVSGGSQNISRRLSPARGVARLTSGGLPTARDADGRQLPRTYVARRRSPTRLGTRTPLEEETPIPTAVEPATRMENAPEMAMPNEGPHSGTRNGSAELVPGDAASRSDTREVPSENGRAPVSNAVAPAPEARQEESAAPRGGGGAPSLASRTLPREKDVVSHGERPVMQLVTLGLLIAMIVLISAAIGLVVGRWMTQR